jgi:hypothetical protein
LEAGPTLIDQVGFGRAPNISRFVTPGPIEAHCPAKPFFDDANHRAGKVQEEKEGPLFERVQK